MISHKDRYIFIHQRKCAGLAIAHALGVDRTSPDFHVFNEGTLSSGGRFGDWSAHPDWTRQYHVFVVCRNPWDRFVSGWRYLKQTRTLPLRAVAQQALEGRFDDEGLIYRHLLRPQMRILVDAANGFVPQSVLRYEQLAADFAQLCMTLNLPRRELSRTNASRRWPYWMYYDAVTRDIVGRLFAADVAAFDYTFEQPSTWRARAVSVGPAVVKRTCVTAKQCWTVARRRVSR